MNETLFQAVSLIIPMILAIVFHEVSHGLMARALGDPTAAEEKRLSLNPLRHVDLVGTVILPGLLALAKGPIFGWAKPVPVNKWRLRNPRYGMMLVAAAGPGINFIMAGVAAVALGGVLAAFADTSEPSVAARFLAANLLNFITINVFLALFNLLPIPPFDGSHILEGLLPRSIAPAYAQLRRWGLPLMIGLVVILPWAVPGFNPVGDLLLPPFEWVTGRYMALAAGIAGA